MGPSKNPSSPSRPNRPSTRRLAGTPLARKLGPQQVAGSPKTPLFQGLTAISGALFLVLVIAKALRVARMDLTTAQVLIFNGSVTNILGGVLLLFFPGFVLISLLALCGLLTASVLARFREKVGRPDQPMRIPFVPRSAVQHLPLQHPLRIAALASLSIILAIVAVPANFFLAYLLITSIVVVIGVIANILAELITRSFHWLRGTTPVRRSFLKTLFRSTTTVSLLTLGAFIIPQSLNDIPWLPPQAVRMDDDTPFLAYEVGRSDGRVILLDDTTRSIRIVSTQRITGQDPCRLSTLANSGPSLWSIFWEESPGPQGPTCEDLGVDQVESN